MPVPVVTTSRRHSCVTLPATCCRLGASAPPVLTITHYPELLDSHNLVLTRADTVNQAIVSVPEVHHKLRLFNCAHWGLLLDCMTTTTTRQ